MRRRHLVEISDEPWCPPSLRHAATDFCRSVAEVSRVFHPVKSQLNPPLVTQTERFSRGRALVTLFEQVAVEFLPQVGMLLPGYKPSDLIAGDPVAEVGEALAHARQGDLLVR